MTTRRSFAAILAEVEPLKVPPTLACASKFQFFSVEMKMFFQNNNRPGRAGCPGSPWRDHRDEDPAWSSQRGTVDATRFGRRRPACGGPMAPDFSCVGSVGFAVLVVHVSGQGDGPS